MLKQLRQLNQKLTTCRLSICSLCSAVDKSMLAIIFGGLEAKHEFCCARDPWSLHRKCEVCTNQIVWNHHCIATASKSLLSQKNMVWVSCCMTNSKRHQQVLQDKWGQASKIVRCDGHDTFIIERKHLAYVAGIFGAEDEQEFMSTFFDNKPI